MGARPTPHTVLDVIAVEAVCGVVWGLCRAGAAAGNTLRGNQGAAYERHTWRKGLFFVPVRLHELHSIINCFAEVRICGTLVNFDAQHTSPPC